MNAMIRRAGPWILAALFVALLPSRTLSASKEDKDFDGIIEGAEGLALPSGDSMQAWGSCRLKKTWESPPSPQNLWQTAVGDPDGDGRKSIVVPHYLSPDATIYDFEKTGDNTFQMVWSDGPRPYGIYSSVAVADLDGDGRGEIVGGSYSREVRVFESIGNDSYLEWPAFPALGGETDFYQVPMTDIEIGDSNGDGRDDVIVVQSLGKCLSHDYPSMGIVTIFSRTGELLYGWLDNSYLRGASSGYFDDDEHLDIFITHGGMGTEPFYLDWIEHTGRGYYRRTLRFPGIGLPTSAHVADIDNDGKSELLVGAVYEGLHQLLVLQPEGDHGARIAQAAAYPSNASPMSIDVGHVWQGTYPEIAVATHSNGGMGQVFFFRFDGTKVVPVCQTGADLAESVSAFYTVDITSVDRDGFADVVIGVGPTTSKVIVLETEKEVFAFKPDISANGADGSITIKRGDPLVITVGFERDIVTRAPIELWLLAARRRPAPLQLFSFRQPGGWVSGLSPAIADRIGSFRPVKVLNSSSLPPGTYILYFGADLDANGELDRETFTYDSLRLEVLP